MHSIEWQIKLVQRKTLPNNKKQKQHLYGEDDNGNIICDLDKDDFLWHQNKYMERIVVDLNGDFKIAEINDDYSLPVDVMRDIKS